MEPDDAKRDEALARGRRNLERTLPFFCSWWAALLFTALGLSLAAILELGVGVAAPFAVNAVGIVVWVARAVAYLALLRLVARKLDIEVAPWPHVRPSHGPPVADPSRPSD